MNGTRALTVRYNGLSRTLVSDVGIATAFDPATLAGNPPPALKAYKGIWDTGATASVITQKVVDDLGLKPIRLTKVHHAQGDGMAEVYLVCIALPNQVAFTSVSVTKGSLPNADALIGMDIIGQGDLAVTNHNETTVFSYRIPSVSTIDFINKNTPIPPNTPTVGRNDPCPCGSGKKYKKCCAKTP